MGRHQPARGGVVALTAATLMTWAVLMRLAGDPQTHLVWGDPALFGSWYRTVADTGSLAGLPYPWLSLVGMLPSGVFGAAGWAVFSLASLAMTTALLATAGSRHRHGYRLPYWWLLVHLLLGPVSVMRLEELISALVVLALSGRTPRGRAAALAAAIWIKVWPVVLLGSVLRRRRSSGVVFGCLLLVLAVPAVLLPGGWDWVGGQGTRSLQVEAVAAWPFLLLSRLSTRWSVEFHLGVESSYAVVGPGAEVVAAVCTAAVAVVLAAGVGVWWISAVDAAPRRLPGPVGLVCLLLIVAPVLSPQYLLWVAAVMAGVAARTGHPPPAAALLLAVCVTTQGLFPWNYNALVNGEPWALGLLLLRHLLLVALCLKAARTEWPGRSGQPTRS